MNKKSKMKNFIKKNSSSISIKSFKYTILKYHHQIYYLSKIQKIYLIKFISNEITIIFQTKQLNSFKNQNKNNKLLEGFQNQ